MIASLDPRDVSSSLRVLRHGSLERAHGLLPWGSNYTFLMDVVYENQSALAVYKPQRGERPLWDFPDGTLCLREVAAFLVSETLGWHIVPPTVLREGPQGLGMVQLFIEHDPEQHYFTFEPSLRDELCVIALFDHLTNNADRKGGHCLLDKSGKLWAIDHGVCFHHQPKLRTVIWDFAGMSIPESLREALSKLVKYLEEKTLLSELLALLSEKEVSAMVQRALVLARTGRFPEPGPGRQYPWPPI